MPPRHAHHPPRPRTVLATCLAVALGLGVLAPTAFAIPAPAAAAPPTTWPLVVTELAPDTSGTDRFEYIEITNTTSADVPLGDGGYGLTYLYGDGSDASRDVPLTVAAGTVVPAGGSVVLWLQYATADFDTAALTDDEFRAHWQAVTGVELTASVVRVTGQPGMANGGDRGIRVLSPAGSEVSRSAYPAGSVGPDRVMHFRTPADAGTLAMAASATLAPPTPGVVDAAQLEDRAPEPTEPTDPGAAEIPGPGPDSLVGTLLVTELVPDTANTGGSDGYEFVEVYNTTTEPIDFSDYTLRYLYPNEDYSNSQTAVWDATPAATVIEPGTSVVAWVKNGANQSLTRADFAAHWGATIDDSRILEIQSGGMANASPRGVEVIDRTGSTVNAAYYNMGGADDVSADRGIRYTVDPADFSRQVLLGADRAPTPGAVDADQVPTARSAMTPDAIAPVIVDSSPTTFATGDDLTFSATVTDERVVRSATLFVRTSAEDEFRPVTLTPDAAGVATSTVLGVDLTGVRFVDYRFEASDGSNRTVTAEGRIAADGVDTGPVRLSVDEGEFVSGVPTLSAAGDAYPASIELGVDGSPLAPTTPQLESAPVFAVDVTQTDAYFRNGILAGADATAPDGAPVGGDVLTVFSEGTYAEWATVHTPVPLSYIVDGNRLVVTVSAGTKARPDIDENENNDDFTIAAPRLVLPDGRSLTPDDAPAGNISMGDSAGKVNNYHAVFTLPDDAFTAVGAPWDTTAVADGPHVVTATDGTNSAEATVQVDNTAPVVAPNIVDGAEIKRATAIEAGATDAGAGIADVVATLDGQVVELPHTVSSTTVAPGEHVLEIVATDAVGNVTTKDVTFTTPVESPTVTLTSPEDGAVVSGPSVDLTADVEDPSGDPLEVTFLEAFRLQGGEAGVAASSGETGVASSADRTAATPLSGVDLASIGAVDGLGATTASDAAFPYQLFEVSVPAEAGDAAQVRVTWSGSANPNAKVLLYVWNTAIASWEEIDRHVTDASAAAFDLQASVPVSDRTVDGVVQVLVQHSEGFAGADLSDRGTVVDPVNPADTPRSEYDFTIGWESDTQYYNETWYEHQLAINDYLLDQREEMNLQYVVHTGDIVDESVQPEQWANADAAYRPFDEAGLPYGVLAGNHDVDQANDDWGPYSANFGEARFAGNPWYGGSYEDNRGHFDLFSSGGIDFLMLSMGWNPGDAEIAWMNEVLAQYPERVAFVNLHEFMLTTGGLGPIPQRIMDEVVAPNANVKFVLSGHYHDAFTRYDGFDDDGDGVDDRTVTSMLFDYQGLPEGGQGFLRLLQFDNEGQRFTVRTYSPSLDRYDSDDPSLDPEHQEFTVDYATAGIVPQQKSLTTDAFTAEVLTDRVIATADGIGSEPTGLFSVFAASATTVTATWTPTDGEHGWYVIASDEFGGATVSPVRRFTFEGTGGVDPGEPIGPGDSGGSGGSGDGGDGDPPGSVLASTGVDGVRMGLVITLLAAVLAGGGWVLVRRSRRLID